MEFAPTHKNCFCEPQNHVSVSVSLSPSLSMSLSHYLAFFPYANILRSSVAKPEGTVDILFLSHCNVRGTMRTSSRFRACVCSILASWRFATEQLKLLTPRRSSSAPSTSARSREPPPVANAGPRRQGGGGAAVGGSPKASCCRCGSFSQRRCDVQAVGARIHALAQRVLTTASQSAMSGTARLRNRLALATAVGSREFAHHRRDCVQRGEKYAGAANLRQHFSEVRATGFNCFFLAPRFFAA